MAKEIKTTEPNLIICYTTWPEDKSPKEFIRTLILERLVACAQILPMESMYVWERKIETANEKLILLKSLSTCTERLTARINEIHPYDVPQIIVVDASSAGADYFKWVSDTLAPIPIARTVA